MGMVLGQPADRGRGPGTTEGVQGVGDERVDDVDTPGLREQLEQAPYHFDRRFIFRILAMGHSQFHRAQVIESTQPAGD